MKLTRSADYAFRIVVYLASKEATDTMPNIATQLQIPYNNVIKLVSKLGKANIIETKQGKWGGICLARAADQINMLEVVHAIEGPVNLSSCLTDRNFCFLIGDCKLEHAFMELQTMMNSFLQNKTIMELKIPEKDRSACHG